MTTMDLAKRYVALCKEGKFEACLGELFAKDAVSVEAGGPPGMDRTAKGLDAIRAKGEWWGKNHEIHSLEVQGPYPNDDRFIVRFTMDITIKQQNLRVTMDEMGLFTVKDGKIVREEFFYTAG
jgi:ketosteroid isomerase-like protein